MVFSKLASIETMNQWGAEHVPFLFIIDFEMKAIQLYRLDIPLPPDIRYSFHGKSFKQEVNLRNTFQFTKHPLSFEEYERAFERIQQQIFAGNSFLVNLTFPTPLETSLTLEQMFEYSRAPYKVLMEGKFVCFSPETFITVRNGRITTRPMKGTINAAIPGAEKIILESIKETAEHHTVVDLLRNDLSLVASEVTVERFRYIDRIVYNEGEILQVSSEISGKLDTEYRSHLGDLLFALLPAGSVTGAPKKMTTAIIRNVEMSDRGYYTGVCGVFDGDNLDSAVMIRFIEILNGKMQYRSGGGITFLSSAKDEYKELIDKVYVPIA